MPYPPAAQATDATNATAQADVHPGRHNGLGAAINDIVAELGANPSGAKATVEERLATLRQISFATIWPFTNLGAAFVEGGNLRSRGRADLTGVTEARIELVVNTWFAGTKARVELSVDGAAWAALLPDVDLDTSHIGGCVAGPWGPIPAGTGDVALRLLMGLGDGVIDPTVVWWGLALR